MNIEGMTHEDVIRLIELYTRIHAFEDAIHVINEQLLAILTEQKDVKEDAKFIILQAKIKVLDDVKQKIRLIESETEKEIEEIKKKGGEDDD